VQSCRRGWRRDGNLLDGIEVLGKRRKGKPQLTEDESRMYLSCALEMARAGDVGAAAAACALLLGMRAGEIAERIVRDLDAGGTKLHITRAKTEAGIRTMKVPEVLQPLLRALADGKHPSDRIFGVVNRHWVLRSVKRICVAAGVPIVLAHGLRGTHARLAVEAGISGDVVAASLGHESFATTAASYAGQDAVAGAAAARVTDALN
jgi:integrase